jgi:uroporphyrinogen-III decarboxylase
MAKTRPSITQESKYRTRIDEMAALWSLEESPCLRWLINLAPAGLSLMREGLSYADFFQDPALQLNEELKALAWVEGLGIDDLFVPHLQPQAGVTIFASAFGCLIDFPENMYPRSHPLLKSGDPAEKVYDLPRPSVTDGQLGEMLEFTDYFVGKTGGRYPIQMTDIQSPVDTAYLVWDSIAFMMAMYDHPQEVHYLMRLVTDLTIDFIREHRARSPEFIPCHYPDIWLPDGMGVAISDDALAVLSPQTYLEFALPYTNELSEEFGGVFIHTCGNFIHQFDNLKKVRELRGINFGATETPFEAVWDHFNDKTAIVPHTGLNKDIHFETEINFLQHVLRTKTHNRGLLVIAAPGKVCGEKLSAKKLREFAHNAKSLIEEDARFKKGSSV